MAGMLQMRRSRGAASGFLLVLLGTWGALIPFIGPYFHYAYTPDTAWTYNTARLWLEILPGAAVFLGGFLLIIATGRHIALFGAMLAAAAGAWFVLGTMLSPLWNNHVTLGGSPASTTVFMRIMEQLGFFSGAGRGHRVHRGRGVRPDRVGGLRDQGRRDRSAGETVPAAETVPAKTGQTSPSRSGGRGPRRSRRGTRVPRTRRPSGSATHYHRLARHHSCQPMMVWA